MVFRHDQGDGCHPVVSPATSGRRPSHAVPQTGGEHAAHIRPIFPEYYGYPMLQGYGTAASALDLVDHLLERILGPSSDDWQADD